VRLDERVPGSGLGLAIVEDLLESSCGRLQLQRSPLGGLQARIEIDRAP
jgi:signal transduction histidine kinase